MKLINKIKFLAENVPTTSDSVPIVGIYLTIIMALSSMSIILTVVVLRLHHTDQFVPVNFIFIFQK